MTETISVIGYDWTGAFITMGVVAGVLLGLGIALGITIDDPTPVPIALFIGMFATLFIWLGFDGHADAYLEEKQIEALEGLGYESIGESAEGYNQWTASKDGEYVRLLLEPSGEADTYYVLEIQE